MRLTTREASIVGKIQESSYCINELVELFNVSNKTIKNDINNINNKISNDDSSIDIIDGYLVF
ncbi:DeoR family transcriptional regulator [Mollicutes bacterium LVI A0078]|nr:DeoR family transcriptional regulator [Mollicutes bacterium LVI A0075]WOO91429.1 DeoR family transcriptional regulator [Mollicutes bacterium LVI A0078]